MKTLLLFAVLLNLCVVFTLARPSKYDLSVLRYVRDQYDLESEDILNEYFKRTDEDETAPSEDNSGSDNNTSGDEDNQNDGHNGNSNSGSNSGIRIVVAGKSFDLCDPMVAHMVQKAKSERFKKYYSLACASSSFGKILSSFSKNGKLKGLVDAYKGGLSPEILDKFFGKRDFAWEDIVDEE